MDQLNVNEIYRQSSGSLRDWLDVDRMLEPLFVAAGDVVYLPKDERAYEGVNRKPLPEAMGRPVLIIETFVDDYQPHRAWVVLVRSKCNIVSPFQS